MRELGALGVEMYGTEATLAVLGDDAAKIQPLPPPTRVSDGWRLEPCQVVDVAIGLAVAPARVGLDEAIGLIDVSAMTLLSAAAGAVRSIAVVSSPRQHRQVLDELRATGAVSADLRRQLAAEALAEMAAYYADVAG